MVRKLAAAIGVVAVAALGLGLSAPPAAAAPMISTSTTSVKVGAALTATASGCASEEPDGEELVFRSARVVLVTGTGAGERLAALAADTRLTVPGWVDPAQPAVLAGTCVEYRLTAGSFVQTVLFTYPDVPIDVLPPSGTPRTPAVSLSRTSAAGGQVIRATGSGCTGLDVAEVDLIEGTDLSGRGLIRFVTGNGAEVAADGTFTVDLALNDPGYDELGDEEGGGPLEEGGYTVIAVCGDDDDDGPTTYLSSEPTTVQVAGTTPSGSIVLARAEEAEALVISGSGCTGGREVTLTLAGYVQGDGFEEQLQDRGRALATGAVGRLGRAALDEAPGSFEQTHVIVPQADGTWRYEWPVPGENFDLQVQADCGDALDTGFRYVPRQWYEFNFAELWPERVSPTSSPVGGAVTIHLEGTCDDVATAVIVTEDGDVLAESGPVELTGYGTGSATLTAPSTPGRYGVAGTCDGDLGYAEPYEVFTPASVAATAPLPAGPTSGWPDAGQRETFHGRLGPITLPAMEMEEMDAGRSARDLGPSELFLDVPRPAGDFALTEISFDLVDADGTPVPKDAAHLHHVVIGNTSADNPACPDGTFGLPGQIIGAAGAERTAMVLPDPYGLVVEDTDQWSGVYDLMSMADHDQTVYLTYDIELRRDVQNVRPVQTYFGSATGCDTFTWTIDGSGVPDVQQHYLTLPKAGRLVAAGAHIHNGGLHADLVDDRGRTLCRSTLTLADEPVHGMGHDGSASGRLSVVGPDEYPPELYDDDAQIESISSCGLAEQAVAGQRLRFDATYANDRARSGVMGIYTLAVWEGGGPADPPVAPAPGGAQPIPGRPSYAG